MEQKISIIIPAYNEEKRIENTLKQYCNFFRQKGADFEIIVVLNACKDNTLEVVARCQKKFKEIRFLNFEKGGKGFAIIEGFKDAIKRDSSLIGFVDADMATPPFAFYDLISHISRYDGAIGSRYLSGSVVQPKQSYQRIIASRIFNFLIRSLLFLNYKDTQCGAKIFRRKVVEKVIPDLSITKWAFDVNLLYLCKKAGFRIKELPTFWQDKEYSKINLKKAGPQMALSIFRLRFLHSPFNFVVRFYDRFISNYAIKAMAY